MKEAMFYERGPDERVRCTLCALYCEIGPGRRGACGVRVNAGGTLYTLVADTVIARMVDPIEKKPFFHFYPGTRSYSIATVGCNFRCLHCQNHEISQYPKGRAAAHGTPAATGEVICPSLREAAAAIPGERISPEAIVRAALDSHCRSIAYTYTEPTIFFELAYETAARAAAQDIANVFVTNGYITEPALARIAPYLHAANIDLKSVNDAAHKRMTGARLQPVLDAIRWYRDAGVWVEITTLIIPGHNDADGELRRTAEFICGVSPEIPWHVSQFYPTYRLLDRPRTPVSVLRRARQIGAEVGLLYVYEGNVPGEGGERTVCHQCGALIIDRYGYLVQANRIAGGSCPDCGARIPGVGL